MSCAGQSVIKVIGGVKLSPLGGVRQSLIGILDLLKVLLDLFLLSVIRNCRTSLVWMVLEGLLSVSCTMAKRRNQSLQVLASMRASRWTMKHSTIAT